MICFGDIEIIIYHSNSLKDKRQVLKSILERIKARYNVSISETKYHEKWNRSCIGVVTISNSKEISESTINKIISFIDNDSRVEIINYDVEII